MDPFVIVKMDVFSYQLLGLLEVRQREMAEILFFEVGEEILCGCIVPAVAASGHGWGEMVLGSQEMIGV